MKGKDTLIRFCSKSIARFQKKLFEAHLDDARKIKSLSSLIQNDAVIDCDIVSFSSTKDFNEQVLSILTFIKHVGTPTTWTIYSDGTHTDAQIANIEFAFAFIKVVKEKLEKFHSDNHLKKSLRPYKNELIHYAKTKPLGKKLLLYLNFEVKRPTIFLDSDVLFYEKSIRLKSMIQSESNGWFLPDEAWGSLDSRYLNNVEAKTHQVNSGFILAIKNFNSVSEGLNFLRSLDYSYEYFSEQTIMHIILSSNDFAPLDSDTFIINTGDQFRFSYLYGTKNIAIRHYTSPVRHKMWQKSWRWHLSL